MTEVSVPISEVLKHITVKVTVVGMRKTLIRVNIGCSLMKLAAKIMGVGVNIDIQ